jgi:hypothetical protein
VYPRCTCSCDSDIRVENYRKLLIDVTGNLRQVAASDEWISASMADTSKCRVPLRLVVILRLVARAIAMTLTTDTSGCERLISLMPVSDLQTLCGQSSEYGCGHWAVQTPGRMECDCLSAGALKLWWSAEIDQVRSSVATKIFRQIAQFQGPPP